jgi:pentatricopeptide repeat protein
MASVYSAQGNYEDALEYDEKSREIREKVLGKGHPSTAITYNNMAGVYANQGEYETALEYYRKAYTIFLKVFGEDHPQTQNTRQGIQIMEKKQNTGKSENGMIKTFCSPAG